MNAPIQLRALPQASAAAEPLAALSRAVLQLHRDSRDWPAASFDARAAELLLSVLPFQACLWGSVRADMPAGSALALHGLYSSGLNEATLAHCLAGHYPNAALLATHIEPLTARRVELRLWRSSEVAGFEDSDAHTLRFVLPHWVEAQRENRLSHAQDGDAAQRHRRSLALCDPQGLLLQADEQALALLRMEWPRWTGGRLPQPLLDAVVSATAPGAVTAITKHAEPAADAAALQATSPSPPPPCFGRTVTVHLSRSGHGVLLDVRRRTNADRLSTRQRDVARLYAQGLTGPQIATHLGLTASTVNNHLGLVFKKLAVKNKLQLLHAMQPDAAPGRSSA